MVNPAAEPEKYLLDLAPGMEILARFSETYPELRNELVIILREQIVNNSTGFKTRARKIIGRLEKE